ncbi:glutamine synthetase family protein [Aidingimonas halophila]|uniref:L-glutamine synthetase n=1 Tax=Aidingimonas halophila TaxID=574349 RepID=A0A1H2SRV5_9GAMM|nr:glutamine synthetase family protein [Aidingimonas halophila]GHC17241.1 glutamine synthetase [Aidingimonas halophila]SDW34352.1 L-glutamine synthetase [Aidingimonas halophila]
MSRMQARDIKTADDARRIVEERGLSHVKVGMFDIDGVMLGKYMRRDKFFAALESGFSFCDVVLGWDSKDELYDNVSFTGWHTGYPDAPLTIVPDSCRDLPSEGEDMLLFLAEFDGPASDICPRGLLKRVLARAREMGFEVCGSLEYEFFMFQETPESIREKGFRDLKPLTPDMMGYSMLRSSVHSELYHELLALSEAMDFPIEGLHTETGPGVLEAAIAVDDALAAGDKGALFKTFTKVWAQRRGLMATFMAKWSPDYPGQSGHIHLSLRDIASGKSAFFDPEGPYRMSAIQRHFVAGQQKLMPEWLAMFAPTINSYTRLIPGFWAPTDATWGVENRTTALRVIPGSDKSQRVEYRLGSADANPYLALSAAIAAGLCGIEQRLEPDAQVKGNAYELDHPEHQALPRTLWDAAQRLKASSEARQWLGDAFVEHFAATREWEERQFRRAITDWELDRYFEII